jgi:hypothetical protein
MMRRARFRRTRAAATVFVVAVLVGTLLSAVPAAQAVANPVRVVATTSSSSQTSRGVNANCPTGLSVYGGGAEIIIDSGTPGNVVLTGSFPATDSLRSWSAMAFEVGGGFAGNWRLRSFAICGPAVPNLQRVAGISVSSVTDRHAVQATCPAGTRAYSAGAGTVNGRGDVYLERIVPGMASGAAAARVRAPLTRDWQLIAFAVCGDPGVLGPLAPFAAFPPGGSNSPQELTQACPAGFRVHGTGAEIVGNGTSPIFIDSVIPDSGLLSVKARGYENPATTVAWGVVVWVVCAG